MLNDISAFIANIFIANLATHSGMKRIVALLFITCKMTQILWVNEEVLLVHHKVTRAYSMSLDQK